MGSEGYYEIEDCLNIHTNSIKLCILYDFNFYFLDESRPWTLWSEWSECSSFLGTCDRMRSRLCLEKNPAACTGQTYERENCGNNDCPGYWELWSSWESCDKRGPIGNQKRKRICVGKNCQGETVQKRNCMYSFREAPDFFDNFVLPSLKWKDQSPNARYMFLETDPQRHFGPDFGHTSMHNYDQFVATYSIQESHPGDKAILRSTLLPGSARGSCLTFWYHMKGALEGLTLHMERPGTNGNKILWESKQSNTQSYGDEWNPGQVSIDPVQGTYMLTFTATKPNDKLHIAIDDIAFYKDGKCEGRQASDTYG
ncbi:MAM and LDL-receptor class A domain-containing protein 1-like [Hydractinia symbiolongicarpus]|uniref:MAM and LDL-receptor class A domain-containing protein 1-like n=1 Tax=Hydractinia symbiolongicarpus TaxID=13093 RepID=UPI0025518850|nr:MAM and LDL-receptor class A domain-containing protein 1-like [Hydractinia symbiolongicarpus]